MNRILIATDGSPSALQAIEVALDLAEEEGSEAIFVHVAPAKDVLPVMGGFGMATPVSTPHELDAADQVCLDDAVRIAEELGLEAKAKLLTGDPAKEIVAYADSVDADLIVIGSHGYGAIAGVLLGSVSRGVLHRTNRPVLIVRQVPQLVEVPA